ncbi:heavy-metal-associated domain-containing protein, partial [Clavibacter zhangzhiyongii]|uniref:heavy-metal-associated domain-containing protein n=1 Tax=Clavibacter zhangzhiyongii TaxID=2768071 RepID=UPI001957CCC5
MADPASGAAPAADPVASPVEDGAVLTRVDLDVRGMTCASCAMRIERKLGRMPGVEAAVNYATHRARVQLPAGTSVEDAIRTIERTGYRASERAAWGSGAQEDLAPSEPARADAAERASVAVEAPRIRPSADRPGASADDPAPAAAPAPAPASAESAPRDGVA